MDHPNRKATIVGLPAFPGDFFRVEDELLTEHQMRGIGSPPYSTKLGAKGTLTFRTGPSYGLWFWEPDDGPSTLAADFTNARVTTKHRRGGRR